MININVFLLFHKKLYIASQNAALLGDDNCIELIDRSCLCYKSIINYNLDITNSLVISPKICYIKVFDITNPRFKEQIWLILSGFHYIEVPLYLLMYKSHFDMQNVTLVMLDKITTIGYGELVAHNWNLQCLPVTSVNSIDKQNSFPLNKSMIQTQSIHVSPLLFGQKLFVSSKSKAIHKAFLP